MPPCLNLGSRVHHELRGTPWLSFFLCVKSLPGCAALHTREGAAAVPCWTMQAGVRVHLHFFYHRASERRLPHRHDRTFVLWPSLAPPDLFRGPPTSSGVFRKKSWMAGPSPAKARIYMIGTEAPSSRGWHPGSSTGFNK